MKVYFSENGNSFSFVNNKWRSQKDEKRMKNTKKTPHSNDIVFLTIVRFFNDELLFHHIQNEKLMRKKLHKTTTDEHILQEKIHSNCLKIRHCSSSAYAACLMASTIQMICNMNWSVRWNFNALNCCKRKHSNFALIINKDMKCEATSLEYIQNKFKIAINSDVSESSGECSIPYHLFKEFRRHSFDSCLP